MLLILRIELDVKWIVLEPPLAHLGRLSVIVAIHFVADALVGFLRASCTILPIVPRPDIQHLRYLLVVLVIPRRVQLLIRYLLVIEDLLNVR